MNFCVNRKDKGLWASLVVRLGTTCEPEVSYCFLFRQYGFHKILIFCLILSSWNRTQTPHMSKTFASNLSSPKKVRNMFFRVVRRFHLSAETWPTDEITWWLIECFDCRLFLNVWILNGAFSKEQIYKNLAWPAPILVASTGARSNLSSKNQIKETFTTCPEIHNNRSP